MTGTCAMGANTPTKSKMNPARPSLDLLLILLSPVKLTRTICRAAETLGEEGWFVHFAPPGRPE